MSAGVSELVAFDNTFVRELPGLYVPWQAATAPAPRLLALNAELAGELGIDPDALRAPQGVAMLVGTDLPAGAEPVAMAYAGHQFGGFSPRLGDGRALLIGELVDSLGRRGDLHLKGSGRTPFSRGGDGKAAIGPMLREYVIGEAMHALGIPTTRALAVVATGDDVARDTPIPGAILPGAVLARVAASHLRVGTFQYAAGHDDPTLLQRLADYAIARHHPVALDASNPYVALFERVMDVQASLIAKWMNVGFIHGVMNTDNMTISGETIDYGPCAFMEAYDPATVFSSIDHAGRYAYGNQPQIAQWNLARLAETLLPLFDANTDAAIEVATELLQSFPDRYLDHWRAGMRAKLGMVDEHPDDPGLIADLLDLLHAQRVDFTMLFRALSGVVVGMRAPARSLFAQPDAFDTWTQRWTARRALSSIEPNAAAAAMDRVNPVYIPRNEIVEEALAAATGGNLAPFDDLVALITDPYTQRAGLERYAHPADAGAVSYQTFCGT
jgi:serine/tyrosine/threonine adenylyltransferase